MAFAWVDVNVGRTNSKEAKAVGVSVGFKKSYRPKMMTMWDPGRTQRPEHGL